MFGTKNESAVSEVISVVLVVALTVILAAIVAAYLFGMIPSLPMLRSVAITATQDNIDQITLVYHGGPDASSLVYSTVVIVPPNGVTPVYQNATHASNILGNKVGSQIIATAGTPGGFSGKDHVIITGRFANNAETVVLDTYI